MTMRRFFALLPLAGFFLFSNLTVYAQQWTSYQNPRFGTKIEIPATGFNAETPPINGDGQSWISRDGKASISVFGSFMTVRETFAEYRTWLEGFAAKEPVNITYSQAKDDWFAYAGNRGDEFVFTKVLMTLTCSAPILNHVIFQYPKSQHQVYAPVMKHLADSLSGSSVGNSCN